MPRFALLIGLSFCLLASPANAAFYTTKPSKLRATSSKRAKVLRRLDANTSLRRVSGGVGPFVQVQTVSGARGFVLRRNTSTTSVEIFKRERELLLLKNGQVKARYRAAFAKGRRLVDKVRQGDLATPEGRFFIAELDPSPKAARYGARSMRLSYPSIQHARRGLAAQWITRRTYYGIVRAIRSGRVPNQRTKLGSSIRIHGGGADRDWTAGCIALDDVDVVALFGQIQAGTRVEVYRSRASKARLGKKGYLSQRLLAAAKEQQKKRALYTNGALRLIRIPFPGGDIRADWAVCTDIIVRALRRVGFDLQAQIHEDARTHPRRYRRLIAQPNPRIDHRRARNHQRFFSHHAIVLPRDRDYKPGDIVLMETIAGNSTPFDHIGIIDDQRDSSGQFRVINIWTVGWRTASMALLGKSYPTITGHFRLPHPFDLP